jgi:DNA-binding Lrp family transcriptional regulator
MKGKKYIVNMSYAISLELTEKEIKVLNLLINSNKSGKIWINIKLKKMSELLKISIPSLIYILNSLKRKGIILKKTLRGYPIRGIKWKRPQHTFYKVREDIFHLWKISKKIAKRKRGDKKGGKGKENQFSIIKSSASEASE